MPVTEYGAILGPLSAEPCHPLPLGPLMASGCEEHPCGLGFRAFLKYLFNLA